MKKEGFPKMKKIADLIITQPFVKDYHTIFQVVSGGGIQRFRLKKVFDLCVPDKETYSISFPNEIVVLVLKFLINMYLKEAMFELAMPLIAFCKHTLRSTYDELFTIPDHPIATISLNFRLSRTLLFCQAVVDAVTDTPRDFSECFVVETRHGYFQGNCYPWFLDSQVSVDAMDHFFIDGVQEHRTIPLGPDIHHYAWIQSHEREGLHYTRYFRSPIIVLAIISYNNLQILTKDNLDPAFYTIKKILKLVFGPHLGLYLYSGDDLDMNMVVEL